VLDLQQRKRPPATFRGALRPTARIQLAPGWGDASWTSWWTMTFEKPFWWIPCASRIANRGFGAQPPVYERPR